MTGLSIRTAAGDGLLDLRRRTAVSQNSSHPPAPHNASSHDASLPMARIIRMIEGLQALAQQLPDEVAAITEHDRVLLADYLNAGISPGLAAARVCRMRGPLQ